MKTLTATTSRPSKLHDEILVAYPVLTTTLRSEYRGTDMTITLPDDADVAGVQAVIVAHNPNTPGAAELADTERTAATTDLQQKATAALTRLAALDTDSTTTDTAAKMQRAIRDMAHILYAMLRHDLSQLP